jgi:hypothetical protein
VTDLPRERFYALGAAYGLLALCFVVGGTVRNELSQRALAENSLSRFSAPFTVALTAYMSVLVVLTVLSFL